VLSSSFLASLSVGWTFASFFFPKKPFFAPGFLAGRLAGLLAGFFFFLLIAFYLLVSMQQVSYRNPDKTS
jgi:hypothetical protein